MPRRVVPPHTYGTPSSVTAYRAIRTFAVLACAGGEVNIMCAVLSAQGGRTGASQVAEQVTETRVSYSGPVPVGPSSDLRMSAIASKLAPGPSELVSSRGSGPLAG